MNFFKIDLADIQTFVKTFQQKSFSKAAEELYISRQSVARSIDNLESELGHKLFVRTPVGITPTDFGGEFFNGCVELLNQMQKLLHLPAEYDRRKKESISFGVMGRYRSGHRIEKMIHLFMEDAPAPHIDIIHYDGGQIIQAVERGDIDFAFANLDSASSYPDIETIELERENFLLLVREDHPFVAASNVTPQMLASQQILLVTKYNFPIFALENYMSLYGIKDFKYYTTGDLSLVPDYIREDGDPALLLQHSANTILKGNPQIVEVKLSQPLMRHSGIIFQKGKQISSTAAHLLNFLVQKFSQQADIPAD